MSTAAPRAEEETVARLLLEAVIAYHKLHYLDCSLPKYLDGIHFELEYDPYIRTDDIVGHKFALWRMELPLINKIVMGYIGRQYHRLIYLKKIIYPPSDQPQILGQEVPRYRVIGYEIKSVRLENR